MFDKPKDWNIAPKSDWVSGKEIGGAEGGMPSLGNPDAHVMSSSKASFDEEGEVQKEKPEMALFRGRNVGQCPAGTSNQSGVCTPNPKSEASIQSKIRAATGGGQWDRDINKPREDRRNSFKRELPSAPKEADPQVRRLTKGGVKARGGL